MWVSQAARLLRSQAWSQRFLLGGLGARFVTLFSLKRPKKSKSKSIYLSSIYTYTCVPVSSHTYACQCM